MQKHKQAQQIVLMVTMALSLVFVPAARPAHARSGKVPLYVVSRAVTTYEQGKDITTYVYDAGGLLAKTKSRTQGYPFVIMEDHPAGDIGNAVYSDASKGVATSMLPLRGDVQRYTYNRRGQIIRETNISGSMRHTLTYTYNGKGLVTKQRSVTRYDKRHHYKDTIRYSYRYDKNGCPTQKRHSEGFTTTYTYTKVRVSARLAKQVQTQQLNIINGFNPQMSLTRAY